MNNVLHRLKLIKTYYTTDIKNTQFFSSPIKDDEMYISIDLAFHKTGFCIIYQKVVYQFVLDLSTKYKCNLNDVEDIIKYQNDFIQALINTLSIWFNQINFDEIPLNVTIEYSAFGDSYGVSFSVYTYGVIQLLIKLFKNAKYRLTNTVSYASKLKEFLIKNNILKKKDFYKNIESKNQMNLTCSTFLSKDIMNDLNQDEIDSFVLGMSHFITN